MMTISLNSPVKTEGGVELNNSITMNAPNGIYDRLDAFDMVFGN